MTEAVAVYGAGGHAKVVLDALEKAGRTVVGVIDDDESRQGTEWFGYPVSSLSVLEDQPHTEIVVAVGDAADRERLTARALDAGYRLASAIHPSAAIGRDVLLGRGVMILAQAAVNSGTRIGDGVIINTGATIDHDCVIGDFAHIAPGAHLAGGIEIGARALIGIGASLVPGVSVGAGSVVGAGAVVLEEVRPGDTVVGVPAVSVARIGGAV